VVLLKHSDGTPGGLLMRRRNEALLGCNERGITTALQQLLPIAFTLECTIVGGRGGLDTVFSFHSNWLNFACPSGE
jgi:hypothetical protein